MTPPLLAVALLMVAILATIVAAPGVARAAFEVRDTSPAALGAVSIDLDAAPMFDPREGERGGVRVGASHAALYQVEGLAADLAWVGVETGHVTASATYAQVGSPGARENRARVVLRERGGSIDLELSVERLQMALEGEPRGGGWTLGAGARTRVVLPRFDLEVSISADRLRRSSGLERFGVTPSIPVTVRIRTNVAALAWVDRWEGDGRRSPRWVLDLPLAGAAWFRLGLGEKPARMGVAFAVRWRRARVSVGRLDQSAGGVISAAAFEFCPREGR